MKTDLSPPWYTLWNEIKSTIGNDSEITVDDLNTASLPYIIPVQVKNDQKAVAIATIVSLHHQLGNISIDIQVKDANGNEVKPIYPTTAKDLASVVELALSTNPWFKKVTIKPFSPFPGSKDAVYIILSKAVIQFYNDDLSDLYYNYNNVVAYVFREVLNSAVSGISIHTSTAEEEK